MLRLNRRRPTLEREEDEEGKVIDALCGSRYAIEEGEVIIRS